MSESIDCSLLPFLLFSLLIMLEIPLKSPFFDFCNIFALPLVVDLRDSSPPYPISRTSHFLPFLCPRLPSLTLPPLPPPPFHPSQHLSLSLPLIPSSLPPNASPLSPPFTSHPNTPFTAPPIPPTPVPSPSSLPPLPFLPSPILLFLPSQLDALALSTRTSSSHPFPVSAFCFLPQPSLLCPLSTLLLL